MRRIPILKVNASKTTLEPSSFEVEFDYTDIFHGREWVTPDGKRTPLFPTKPDQAEALVATTFEVVGSTSHSGKYTVYTQTTADATPAASFANGRTTIRVREPIGHATIGDLGYITNISTYRITVEGEDDIVVLEKQHRSDRPVELSGRLSSGWAESLLQTQVKQAQSFAGAEGPAKPFLGQLWFDTTTKALNVFDGDVWKPLASEKCITIPCGSRTTVVQLGVQGEARAPFDLALTRLKASLSTPQTSGAIVQVNVKVNGLSILARQLGIANEHTTSLSSTQPEIVFPIIRDDDLIEVEVSRVADPDNRTAKGLVVHLIGL